MKMLDFTLTATIRPEILDISLSSFSRNMININFKECRLFINVDPMPQEDINKVDSVIEISKKYFGEVISRTPNKPNFSMAVKWLWESAETDPIFHLEDDWELFSTIDFSSFIKYLRKKNIYQLRLTKFLKKSATSCYGLSPCLVRRSFYSVVAENLNMDKNPERQLRFVKSWDLKPHSKKTIRSYPNSSIVIKDIGREWRARLGMSKYADENDFISWQYKMPIIK